MTDVDKEAIQVMPKVGDGPCDRCGGNNPGWAVIREDEKELAWQERWEHGYRVGREEGGEHG